MMNKFDGFPQRNGRSTPLPAAFFSDLLPLIDDLAELKVTLFCFWALYQREGSVRYLSRQDFANDQTLLAGLEAAAPDSSAADTLDKALARACERESLLKAEVEIADAPTVIYFMNTERGRTAVAQIEAGQWQPGAKGQPIEILPERPNIYRLYEENIGPLTPMIADALKDAERDYPARWLEDAIKIAVESNARSWRFIQAVLERRKQEGVDGEATTRSDRRDGKWYISGKYADLIDH
jgi:DnaD/phage-associated family protein